MAFIYVTEQGAVLQKRGQRLLVQKEGKLLLDMPAIKVEGVLIFGNVQFTTQALRLMLDENIEMALFTSRGRLLGQLTSPATKNIALRKAQYARADDPDFALKLSGLIVAGKLTNCLEMLRGFSHNHPETDLKAECGEIEALRNRVENATDLSELLGLEGAGARAYFQAFAKMIRRSFAFDGRRRRPATDPVNALLSLGYTMVYNEISSILDGMGFDPYLGYYHQPRHGHATLASDLLEEFRTPLVDRLALTLVNNQVFAEDDFFLHPASGGMHLKDEPRKRYFAEYERFVNRSADNGAGFRGLFRQQAERLRDAIVNQNAYQPYRFEW